MEMIVCKEESALFEKLNSPKLEDLAKKIDDRLVFYMYPEAEQIIRTFLYPRFIRADKCSNQRGLIYFLYGDYHVGKSHLLTYFSHCMERNHPEYWEKYEYPILKIDLNNHINTSEQLLLFLLEKLKEPVDHLLVNKWKKTNSHHERL